MNGYPLCLRRMGLEDGWEEAESGGGMVDNVLPLWRGLEPAPLEGVGVTVRGAKTWICSKTRRGVSPLG